MPGKRQTVLMTRRVEDDGITDSDEEIQDDKTDSTLNAHIQESINKDIRAFNILLNKPEYINNKNDPTTNIVDRLQGRMYNIPDKTIPMFFKCMEICRRSGSKIMMYEKQLEYSGIMLDFDVYQAEKTPQITNIHFSRLCQDVVAMLVKYLDLHHKGTDPEMSIFIGFTRKPKILYDDVKKAYKDGFHMIIPSVKTTRPFKKFLINTLINEKIMDKVFYDVLPHTSCTREGFLDKNSAHVGVHFIGASTKVNNPPYELVYVVKTTISIEYQNVVLTDITKDIRDNGKINICYEFSLNWERDRSKYMLIKKGKYDPRENYILAVKRYENTIDQFSDYRALDNGENDGDGNGNENNMGSAADDTVFGINDPDAGYIKQLLDNLNPIRAHDYQSWYQVLCVLASLGPAYMPLGEYFSRKCPEKFNEPEFRKLWTSIIRNGRNSFTIGSLHYWAKTDNIDRYAEIQNQSIYTMIYKRVFDPTANGQLGHFDVAKILHKCLNYKYAYDRETGMWYEFILENDPHQKGELYKWREYKKDKPTSLKLYISEVLPGLFSKTISKIKEKHDSASNTEAKYFLTIFTNLQKTCKNLMDHGFKHNVMSEAESLFDRTGFARKLDRDPNILGVGNGVLKLGPYPKLLTGYHGYAVSKFTSVNYIPFNPYDDITKKLLITLRNLFPDIESDSYAILMFYLGSTLDGKNKESMFFLLVGKGSNGKSVLVELVKSVMGEHYAVKLPISFITQKTNNADTASPALMMLENARFVYYSESNQCEILNMAKIKEFTGQETLAGRKLYSNMVNFKPHCHHLVASNQDFEIPGTDHGTWRRIKYLPMKITFRAEHEKIDPKNIYERRADPEVGDKWADDEKYQESFLSILVHYYSVLQRQHKGKVLNVPHPHLRHDTDKFRNRQDTINKFLYAFLVKCNNDEQGMTLDEVVDKYVRWYVARYPDDKNVKKWAHNNMENSVINKFLVKNQRGITSLRGYRVLDITESKLDNEQYYCDMVDNKTTGDGVKSYTETATEYHQRMCKEYDEFLAEQIKKQQAKIAIIKDMNKTAESLTQEDLDALHEPEAENPPSSEADLDSDDESSLDSKNIKNIKNTKNDNNENYEVDENGIKKIANYDPNLYKRKEFGNGKWNTKFDDMYQDAEIVYDETEDYS